MFFGSFFLAVPCTEEMKTRKTSPTHATRRSPKDREKKRKKEKKKKRAHDVSRSNSNSKVSSSSGSGTCSSSQPAARHAGL